MFSIRRDGPERRAGVRSGLPDIDWTHVWVVESVGDVDDRYMQMICGRGCEFGGGV